LKAFIGAAAKSGEVSSLVNKQVGDELSIIEATLKIIAAAPWESWVQNPW
jgi:hypothetical protein